MKTPLTDYLEIHNYKLDSKFCKFWLQKEKAFAFDCFEAGKLYGIDLCLSTEDVVETREPKFDEFYSKYAEQHAD